MLFFYLFFILSIFRKAALASGDVAINGCPQLDFQWHTQIQNIMYYTMNITDVTLVQDNLFEITLHVLGKEQIPLQYLYSLKIIGVNGPTSTVVLYGKNENTYLIDNPTDFTVTFQVYATLSDCQWWLPNFQIQFEYLQGDAAQYWQTWTWGTSTFDLSTGCNNYDNQGHSQTDFPGYCWALGLPSECGVDSNPSSSSISTSSYSSEVMSSSYTSEVMSSSYSSEVMSSSHTSEIISSSHISEVISSDSTQIISSYIALITSSTLDAEARTRTTTVTYSDDDASASSPPSTLDAEARTKTTTVTSSIDDADARTQTTAFTSFIDDASPSSSEVMSTLAPFSDMPPFPRFSFDRSLPPSYDPLPPIFDSLPPITYSETSTESFNSTEYTSSDPSLTTSTISELTSSYAGFTAEITSSIIVSSEKTVSTAFSSSFE